MSNETFEQGWAARPFAEQFPELPEDRAEFLYRLNRGITDLYVADLLTCSQIDAIRQKRFPKGVSEEIGKARKAAQESSA